MGFAFGLEADDAGASAATVAHPDDFTVLMHALGPSDDPGAHARRKARRARAHASTGSLDEQFIANLRTAINTRVAPLQGSSGKRSLYMDAIMIATVNQWDPAAAQKVVPVDGAALKRRIAAPRAEFSKKIKAAVAGAKKRAKAREVACKADTKQAEQRIRMLARARDKEAAAKKRLQATARKKRAKERAAKQAAARAAAKAGCEERDGGDEEEEEGEEEEEEGEDPPYDEGEDEDEDEDEGEEDEGDNDSDGDYGAPSVPSYAASAACQADMEDEAAEQVAAKAARKAAGCTLLNTEIVTALAAVKQASTSLVFDLTNSQAQHHPALHGGLLTWPDSKGLTVVCRGITTILPAVVFGYVADWRRNGPPPPIGYVEAGIPPFARKGRAPTIGRKAGACCQTVKVPAARPPADADMGADGRRDPSLVVAREHGIRVHYGLEQIIKLVSQPVSSVVIPALAGAERGQGSVFGDCAISVVNALLKKNIVPLAAEVKLRTAYGGIQAIVDAVGVWVGDNAGVVGGGAIGTPVLIELKTGSSHWFDVSKRCDPFVRFRTSRTTVVSKRDTPLLGAQVQAWAALLIVKYAYGVRNCMAKVVHVGSADEGVRVYNLEPFMYEEEASRIFYAKLLHGHLSDDMIALLGLCKNTEAADKRERYAEFKRGARKGKGKGKGKARRRT